MKIGISTYTYTWAIGVPGYPSVQSPMKVKELLKQAKKLGVDLVQICDNVPLHELELYELQQIRNLANELDIKLEIGTRGVEPEHLRQYLEICRFFGANLLRTILQKRKGAVSIEEAARLMKEVLPDFEASGIQIAIENHERHQVEELVTLVQNLNSSSVGICLDTVNSFGALEGPKYVIETLAPYTVNLHVKDFVIKRLDHMMGFQVTGAPAGSGQLDMEFVLKELKKYGKEPNVILELWTPYTQSIDTTVQKEEEWAYESIKYLKGCIA